MNTSDRDRWRVVEEHLDAALDLQRDERHAYVEGIEDTSIRGEVSQLLKQTAMTGDFLDETVLSGAPELIAELEEQLDPAITHFEPGRMLGPYQLVERIGQGGMGVVYRAERADGHFKRQVAVKLMNRGLEDESARTRFMSETQILADIDHPNVARLLDGGVTDEGFLYIVMEYIEGRPVDRHCDARAMTIPERIALFITICEAVDAAHERGIVHRDLKPGNILVNDEGQVKLLDFGIAKLTFGEDGTNFMSLTQTGFLLMTPDYAAPEQLLDLPITAQTDVYALGLLLYKLLAGVSPYNLKSVSPAAVERIICEDKVRKASDVAEPVENRKQLRGDVDRILLRALDKKPERRFSTAGEFATELGKALESLKPAPGLTIPALTTDTTPVRLSEEDEQLLKTKPPSSKRWLLPTMVASLVVLTLAMVVLLRIRTPQNATAAAALTEGAVVVVPFTDHGSSLEHRYLSHALSGLLRRSLRAQPDILVRHMPDELTSTVGLDPLAVSREMKAQIIVFGSYRIDGEAIEIGIQVLEMPEGQEVWRDRWRQPANDLESLTARLESGLIGAISRQPKPHRPILPRGAATFYLRGLDHAELGHPTEAVSRLRRATEVAPDFAPARTELARMRIDQAREEWSSELYDQGERDLERALELAPDDFEARLIRAQLWIETNRVERALVELRILERRAPLDARVLWSLSDAYLYSGLLEEALAAGHEARNLDPLAGRNPFTALAFAHQAREFRDSLLGSSPRRLFYRGIAHLYLGQEVLARAQFARSLPSARGQLKRLTEGWIAALDGRTLDGRQVTDELFGHLVTTVTTDGQEVFRLAQLVCQLGNNEAALRILEDAIELGFFCSRCLSDDPLLAGLTRRPELLRLQDRAAARTMRLRSTGAER